MPARLCAQHDHVETIIVALRFGTAETFSRENSLHLHLCGKDPRGSSLAVADAPAALGMTAGKRIAGIAIADLAIE
jgi:hypothetical protein